MIVRTTTARALALSALLHAACGSPPPEAGAHLEPGRTVEALLSCPSDSFYATAGIYADQFLAPPPDGAVQMKVFAAPLSGTYSNTADKIQTPSTTACGGFFSFTFKDQLGNTQTYDDGKYRCAVAGSNKVADVVLRLNGLSSTLQVTFTMPECACVADNATACAGKNCGSAGNNCNQTVSCGTCSGVLNSCIGGQCVCVPNGTFTTTRGACSVTCGGGQLLVTQYDNCGTAVSTRWESCNTQACCAPNTYSSTGACNASCGGGQQLVTLYNSCWQPTSSYWQSCNTQSCCTPNAYSTTGGCNASCGGGQQLVTLYNSCNQPTSSYYQRCNTQACCSPSYACGGCDQGRGARYCSDQHSCGGGGYWQSCSWGQTGYFGCRPYTCYDAGPCGIPYPHWYSAPNGTCGANSCDGTCPNTWGQNSWGSCPNGYNGPATRNQYGDPIGVACYAWY